MPGFVIKPNRVLSLLDATNFLKMLSYLGCMPSLGPGVARAGVIWYSLPAKINPRERKLSNDIDDNDAKEGCCERLWWLLSLSYDKDELSKVGSFPPLPDFRLIKTVADGVIIVRPVSYFFCLMVSGGAITDFNHKIVVFFHSCINPIKTKWGILGIVTQTVST